VGQQPLGMIDLVLCEVLQGVRGDAGFARVKRGLLRFDVFDSGGTAMAIASVGNYRLLRSRGRTVRKMIDCFLATFCLRNRHMLLHRDRDFDPFETELGLQVVHP
jgi:predicted nucleic acid-binding protein